MLEVLNKFRPIALLIVRVLVGYMFLQHGLAKFFEYPMSMTGGNGSVPLASIYGFAGILEIAGGALLILGLFTRPVAFLLSGQMAYAYFVIHGAGGNILQPILNKGEPAALFSLIFLMFVFAGAGKYSLDAKFCNKNKEA